MLFLVLFHKPLPIYNQIIVVLHILELINLNELELKYTHM